MKTTLKTTYIDDKQTPLKTANDTRRAVPRATQPLVELPVVWRVRHETLHALI